jgi:hypothetical protein
VSNKQTTPRTDARQLADATRHSSDALDNAYELSRELERQVCKYWQRRCVKAEELLIHVGCDPDWTATVSAHFDKIRDGDKAKTPAICSMQTAYDPRG